MKNWIKKIGQNKFQFFFFLGMLGLLVFSLVLSATLGDKNSKTKEPTTNQPSVPSNPDVTDPIVTNPEEVFKLPFADDLDYVVVRKFYEKDGTKEEQEMSLIKFQNSYRTSNGTSYAMVDNKTFDVKSIFSGKVIEIKESPLYGNYVVVEHNNGVKTYYYGLSEVTVLVGSSINQGDTLGKSGVTEIDNETGNHVYIKITKDNKHLNPEKQVGRKLSAIK